jgi:hypothetical protein
VSTQKVSLIGNAMRALSASGCVLLGRCEFVLKGWDVVCGDRGDGINTIQ